MGLWKVVAYGGVVRGALAWWILMYELTCWFGWEGWQSNFARNLYSGIKNQGLYIVRSFGKLLHSSSTIKNHIFTHSLPLVSIRSSSRGDHTSSIPKRHLGERQIKGLENTLSGILFNFLHTGVVRKIWCRVTSTRIMNAPAWTTLSQALLHQHQLVRPVLATKTIYLLQWQRGH